MSILLSRLIDVTLVIVGALFSFWTLSSTNYDQQAFDGMLVAFAAACTISVFPACGIYRSIDRSNFLRLVIKTTIGWGAVQGGGILLLYILGRTDILKSIWFFYWTIVSGGAIVGVHTASLVISRVRARPAGARPAYILPGDAPPSPLTALPLKGRFARHIKRIFDLISATFLILLLSPAFLLIAFLVKRDGGPATFGHTRVGRDGKMFRCLKFRTMIPNAEAVLKELLARDPAARGEWEREFKLKNDIRITKIGHFLRRTSLDEFPQLLNVLRGEMSLVGPRPVVKDELRRYGEYAAHYLSVTPGMTGLWQVSGRNDIDYSTRVALDVSYIARWTFLSDVEILLRTVGVVLQRRGAY